MDTEEQGSFYSEQKHRSLLIFLWDVQTVGQTSQKGLHYHMVHGQTSFQASERKKKNNTTTQKQKTRDQNYLKEEKKKAVRCVWVWPAYVVNGNVSELLVHGRLVFPAGKEVEGRLRVLIGDVYSDFSRALKRKRYQRDRFVSDELTVSILFKFKNADCEGRQTNWEQVYKKSEHCGGQHFNYSSNCLYL